VTNGAVFRPDWCTRAQWLVDIRTTRREHVPTYQYVCTECTHPHEARQSFSDPALTDCPQCDGTLRKVFSAVGVVFKGSGFYRNDSRGPQSESGESGDKDAGSSSKDTGSKDSDSKESGSKDSDSKESGSSKDTGSTKDSKGSGSQTSGSPVGATSGPSPSTSSTAGADKGSAA
jgi:putative FmdB family regulatory protein